MLLDNLLSIHIFHQATKEVYMKTIAFMMVLFMLAAGTALAKDYEVTKKAGEYNVLVRIDKNPPVAGDNSVEITVTDSAGKAVVDAGVLLLYTMPAMPGMPAMNYKAVATVKGSVYKAKVNYSMSGSWNNEVKITRGGKTASAKFTVDAK